MDLTYKHINVHVVNTDIIIMLRLTWMLMQTYQYEQYKVKKMLQNMTAETLRLSCSCEEI